jgi:hypothetical protein
MKKKEGVPFEYRHFIPEIVAELPSEDLRTHDGAGRAWMRDHPGVWINVGEFIQTSLNSNEFEVVKRAGGTFARYVGTGS